MKKIMLMVLSLSGVIILSIHSVSAAAPQVQIISVPAIAAQDQVAAPIAAPVAVKAVTPRVQIIAAPALMAAPAVKAPGVVQAAVPVASVPKKIAAVPASVVPAPGVVAAPAPAIVSAPVPAVVPVSAPVVQTQVVAPVAAVTKKAVPAAGVSYSLGVLFDLINTGNQAKSANFIVPVMNNAAVPHEKCWPMQGMPLSGSMSAAQLGISSAWIAANKGIKVKLQQDSLLVNFLAQDTRLTSARDKDGTSLKDKYMRVLLYFVLGVNGVNYRFYLSDPFPGKIQGKIVPARIVVDGWDLQRSFRQ